MDEKGIQQHNQRHPTNNINFTTDININPITTTKLNKDVAHTHLHIQPIPQEQKTHKNYKHHTTYITPT